MNLKGKTIVLTGASGGIGEQAAIQLALLGANICLIARRADELERVQNIIHGQGGNAWIYPVDITLDEDAKQCIEQILSEHVKVDVLINNAARSIRRPITQALDRLHDYERTMQINYFAALRLTLGFLPHFLANGRGHIINISTMSTQVPIPLFSAYLASKSALESFSRSLSMELGDQGIDVSIVYFPMVRTPMSSKTTIYKHMRMLDTSTAASWIVKAVQQKSYRITSTSGAIANALLNTAPATVMNLTRPLFRLMDRRLEKKLKDKSS
ncbi:SDR family NAD(P)-dependent oxidoreductase [Acinetobacter sp. NIPH 2699]|uniref:SDR family NAD(P)-dependent oxidoreductase n=1 Tax=Acinetobacter sp. NIPH 2699 TaxID=2923433 RepID=UPI001F4AA04C|nr:SDR family NAD(P)-dependent oxidoreductase [Acinetobacter sp. NIPH 2699]MCH7337654.1 SDR family NAD(P)-dependent oxidoreductase [Acinetobacter sp. NIPH 2699]